MPSIIGLTGGIATGKSTVARWLEEAGARLLDADVLAREVVLPGTPGYAAVATRFPSAITPEGELDRRTLGALVFSDEAARKDLEAIVHPRVGDRLRQGLSGTGDQVVVLVIPLLFEAGLEHLAHEVWVVSSPPELQLERLLSRDRLSPEEAHRRIASQWPIERKEALADRVIANTGTLEELRAQVAPLIAELGLGRGTDAQI